jgi:hypothetical protein
MSTIAFAFFLGLAVGVLLSLLATWAASAVLDDRDEVSQ